MKRAARARARALVLSLAPVLAAACSAAPIDVARLPKGSLTSALIAHYTFDEPSGDVAFDDSGNMRDATVTGATRVMGQFQGALHFVPGDAVTVPAFPAGTPSFTVALWARIDTAEAGGYVTLLSTEIIRMGGWEMNTIFDPPPFRYHFAYYVGPDVGDYDFVECGCFMPDRWMHLAAVVDGEAGLLRLYVNGVRVSEAPARATIKAGTPTLYMGTWGDTSMLRELTGALDDVGIWSRALVPEEVAGLAAHPLRDL